MAKYIIKGSNKLEGKVKISGSKNAALPIIAASILNAGKTTLYNVPNIHDTQMMFEILKNLGGKVEKKNNKIIIDTSKIKKYEIILGLTKVQGEGVTITVADNNEQKDNSSFASINNSNYLVHDGNLVAIINELKIAGAEAISINGKRIVNSTSINCAGNVIQINGEKVGSPFVINAIGDKDLLYGELTKNGGTLYKLKKYGVLTSIKKADSIEIDKEI